MLPWSLCRLWQPDRAANAAQDTRSYTTARGTICAAFTKTYNTPSFRGDAAGGEPGIHIPEACVHGFRAASFRSAPGMTIIVQSPAGGERDRVRGLCFFAPTDRASSTLTTNSPESGLNS